jgi:NAD-specific glutamate dehydrogenase
MVQNVVPSKQVLCDEGSYFSGCSPTPGTAITFATTAGATSYVNTSGFAVFKNNDNAANPKAKRVYLDYIGVKRFDVDGNPSGEFRIVGLFTSTVYIRSIRSIR